MRSHSANYYRLNILCTYKNSYFIFILISSDFIHSYLRYETDVIKVRQQVDILQHDLMKEMQQKATVEKQNAELHMVHERSRDNFTAELQVEEQKNKLLHEELDKISASHQEISQRY